MYPDGAAAAAPFFCMAPAPKGKTVKSFTRFFSKNHGVQRQRLWSPVATGETPAGRSQRNTRAAHGAKYPPAAAGEILQRPKAPSADGAIPGAVHDGPMVPAAAPVGVDGGDHLFRLA